MDRLVLPEVHIDLLEPLQLILDPASLEKWFTIVSFLVTAESETRLRARINYRFSENTVVSTGIEIIWDGYVILNELIQALTYQFVGKLHISSSARTRF